jgi:hypothetical protein
MRRMNVGIINAYMLVVNSCASFLLKQYVNFRKGRSMDFNKIKVFFSKVFLRKNSVAYNDDLNSNSGGVHSVQPNSDINAQYSEMEVINNLLLSETIGDRGDLWHHYQRLIKNFSVEKNPLGVSDAKIILCSLLLKATAKRRMFSTRIAHSVESGSIFNKYFGKMEYINQLSVITYRRMKKMQTAREKYEDEKKRLNKIMDESYKNNNNQSNNVERQQKVTDIWEAMDLEGGEVEYESSKETRND